MQKPQMDLYLSHPRRFHSKDSFFPTNVIFKLLCREQMVVTQFEYLE
jgi:hypothetical protein